MKATTRKPIVRNAPKPPRKADDSAERLAWHSKDTGIPADELQRICIRAGLDQLDRGGLTIRKRTSDKLPVFLPAGMVTFLRELCDASGIQGGLDEYVDYVINTHAQYCINRNGGGADEMILNCWRYTPAEAKEAENRMQAVMDRWETNGRGEFVRKEVAAREP